MTKKKSAAFGYFLGKIRENIAKKEKKSKITTTEMAKKVGFSQTHWFRAEKQGYILSQDKINQIISSLDLDPITAKILLAHGGYSNRNISLLGNAHHSLASTQKVMYEMFYQRKNIGIMKSLVISWLDPEIEIPEYTKYLCSKWQNEQHRFSTNEIEKFIEARKQRKQTYLDARITSQFIILDTILEKSVMIPSSILTKQIEHIIEFMKNHNFIEIRILQPGPTCPHPATNFRLYANNYLWLGYMYYGEVVCGEMDPQMLRHFDTVFCDYWNRALNKEKTIQYLCNLLKKTKK
ncbi:Scr1 family TA system antitoxin-like transcriptional regulator [Candidatus Uabimicrobium sp. HlEnr_7]|uniref:Scr1 family TA system antitoxin-like transcriptional regulator n=1 Tax=Candidatus Uabimicrobium helgolandensis TaxID=3095367 RepID=UPI00355844E5